MRAAIIKVLAGLLYVVLAFFICAVIKPINWFWQWSSNWLFDLLWRHQLITDTYEWGMDPPSTIMLVVIVLVIAWLLARGVKVLRAKIGR
ncbi:MULTISPECIES: hypothetical protein [Kosakonia]|uniref:Uncharacterized protein n=1 Tax=Kosakonia quasisacchari TaxID=2529380 RepID=A0A4R0H6P7_9ENTR|nr:hypothetical protein [Kosakonia quasisacchari]TCC04540.1 hypothetical protein E0L21_14925 [Kosakonia quasisacchari]